MSSENQFDKIALAVTEKHVAVVKDTLDQSKIADLKQFYHVYRQELVALDKEFSPSMSATTKPPSLKPEFFADVYKYLDVFPPNMQKPKKLPPMRDRLNSTISKSSPSLNDLASNQQNNSTSFPNATKCEDLPKPMDTYRNFQKFQTQLKQLGQDIAEHNVDQEYALKLKQLHNFSQQLEKVLPKEKAALSALATDQEMLLEDLVDKMDNMNFIRDNQDICRQSSNGGVFNNSQRLDNLVEILSHSLIAVDSFNIIYNK